ncbi:unnamed protein product, partial [marine sediment metagenome]
MKILVVGSGGREHTLVWKFVQEGTLTGTSNNTVYCIPGNGGISQIAQCVNIGLNKFDEIKNFVRQNKIDITVVGPEVPLADGIVDSFQEQGLKIFGPNKTAAQLESSKSFAKMFMKKYDMPTAEFEIFDN